MKTILLRDTVLFFFLFPPGTSPPLGGIAQLCGCRRQAVQDGPPKSVGDPKKSVGDHQKSVGDPQKKCRGPKSVGLKNTWLISFALPISQIQG